MFGALGFGQLAFGQSVTGAGLSTETSFGLATSATLGSGLPIAADAALAVTVAAVLSAGTPLAVETGFAIGTSADIPGATQVIFLVNGSGGARVRFPSLTIHDVLGAQPNTASLVFEAPEVPIGSAIAIGYRSLTPSDLLFAGQVQNSNRTYESTPRSDLTSWPASLIDHSFALNKRRPIGRYIESSITAIAQNLIAVFAPAFTSTYVQAGLPAVTINFDGAEPLLSCLNQLATLCGGQCKVDYNRNVHLYIPPEANVPAPDPLDPAHPPLNNPPIEFGLDLSQVRTRIYGKGHGEDVPVDVAAGDTILPVKNQVMFHAVDTERALAVVAQTAEAAQTDILSYWGVSRDAGRATTVRGLAQVPGTPTGAALAVSGHLQEGSYSYRQTYVNERGDETEPGAPSSLVTIVGVAAPTTHLTLAQASGSGNLGPGSYYSAGTCKIKDGETRYGPIDAAVITGVGDPSAGPGAQQIAGLVGNLTAGTYYYRVTFKSSAGETLGSSSGMGTIAAAPQPPSGPAAAFTGTSGQLLAAQFYYYYVTFLTAAGETLATQNPYALNIPALGSPSDPSKTATTGGAMAVGQYFYKVTFVTPTGETSNSTSSFTIILSSGQTAVQLTGIATGDSRVTARRVYRTRVNSSGSTLADYWLLVEIGDNSTTSFLDTKADASLGVTNPPPIGGPVAANASKGQASITGIPTTSDSRVTGRNVYRTRAGGTIGYLVRTLNDAVTTSFLDNVADDSLGKPAPTVSTAVGGQMSVYAIPTSSDPRVTGRNVYRTSVAGTDYRLVRGLNDNTTTGITDNMADESRGEPLPTVNSAIGGQMTIGNVPVSSDARVTGRHIYRTPAATPGADYRLVRTLGDNTTTSFVDNTPDASRGAPIESVSTATSAQIAVSNIALGPTGTTARRLYRTPVNGSAYKLVGAVGDNVTTTFTDNVADSSLGREPPAQSNWRPPAGATSVLGDDLGQGTAGTGWVVIGTQRLHYTGRVVATAPAGSLTGIPASGAGSLVAAPAVGTPVIGYGFLKNINDGAGVTHPIAEGSACHIWIQRDDAQAQTDLVQLERNPDGSPTDGIREYQITDDRRGEESLIELCDADLAKFARPIVDVTYATFDRKTKAGLTVHIALEAPPGTTWGPTGDYVIQEVTITIDPTRDARPRYTVHASSAKFSFADLLQRVLITP